MNAGKLNRRIAIQSQSTSQDSFGGPLTTWITIIKTWAGIRAVTSKEVYAASGFTSQVSHLITLRYHPELHIRSAYRIEYEGRIFQIQSVGDPDEGKRQVNLLCLELDEGKT
jgi:SPP1 family predicted phage head-tail adaptor